MPIFSCKKSILKNTQKVFDIPQGLASFLPKPNIKLLYILKKLDGGEL